MKKILFTATLLITIILMPFLAFSDGNEHETNEPTLTKTTVFPSDVYAHPQYGIEDGEYSGQAEMEFRVCG